MEQANGEAGGGRKPARKHGLPHMLACDISVPSLAEGQEEEVRFEQALLMTIRSAALVRNRYRTAATWHLERYTALNKTRAHPISRTRPYKTQ